MICVFCCNGIDDDSFYCDQCGKEILMCPECGRSGKRKVCTFDGTALVPVKSGSVASSPTVIEESKEVAEETAQTEQGKVSEALLQTEVGILHLVNKTLGLDLKPQDGDIIGRTSGQFVDAFGKYPQVSGKHLEVKFDPGKGWLVKDLDSTNGTKYNKKKLEPFKLCALADKAYIHIANIEFYIQIEEKVKTVKNGTLRL